MPLFGSLEVLRSGRGYCSSKLLSFISDLVYKLSYPKLPCQSWQILCTGHVALHVLGESGSTASFFLNCQRASHSLRGLKCLMILRNIRRRHLKLFLPLHRQPIRPQSHGTSPSHASPSMPYTPIVAAADNSLTHGMLERARAIAHNHDELSKQLSSHYNADTAKKIGDLSNTATILKEWEKAKSVRDICSKLCVVNSRSLVTS